MRLLILVMVAAVLGCGDDRLSPAEARLALADLGIDYKADAFLEAAKDGDLVVVKRFVQAGMSVNTAGSNGVPALYRAADEGHLEVVRFLVEQGADMNAWIDGSTVLHWAARKGHLAVVRYLESVGG